MEGIRLKSAISECRGSVATVFNPDNSSPAPGTLSQTVADVAGRLQSMLMDPQITASLIGAGATLITGVGAVWTVVWQIGKQARLAVDQSAHNERLRLKLDVYRAIANECEQQQERINRVSPLLVAFKWRLPTYFDGSTYRLPPGVTGQELMDLVYAVQGGAADLLILLERWEIIDPRLDLFKLAINSAVHDIRTAWDDFSKVGLEILPPMFIGEDGAWSPPPDAARKLLDLIPQMESALLELTSYMHDFRIEMQNLLLSELFETRVAARVPIDPKKVAVRLDQYEELKKHFRENTQWGRHVDDVNERVRLEFSGRDN